MPMKKFFGQRKDRKQSQTYKFLLLDCDNYAAPV